MENETFSVERCALLVEECASCNISRGKTLSVAGFWCAVRGVGGRLSQFCCTMALFVSTIILSGEK